MQEPVACLKEPIRLHEGEKQLWQFSTNQPTTGPIKHFYDVGLAQRFGIEELHAQNFAILGKATGSY